MSAGDVPLLALKPSMMKPTNRFITNRAPKKMYTTRNKALAMLASFFGDESTSVTSTHADRIETYLKVLTCNKDRKDKP